MPDDPPPAAPEAPIIPSTDLLFEVRFFKSHHLLADYHRGKLEDEVWVSIGGDYIRLPNHYGATLLDRNGLDVAIDPSEEFRHPRLYAPEIEWHGYVPDTVAWYLDHPEDDILWVYQYFAENETLLETDDGTVKIPGSLINEIIRDLREARVIVCRLEERGGLPLTMVDSGYRPRWLWQCEGEVSSRYGLYKARSCLLHLLGAIAWGVEHVDEWTKGLLTRTRGASLRRWLVLGAPRLGFVLDPRDPRLDAFPLLDLLQSRCPLYYPWSYRWRPEQSNTDLNALAGIDSRNFAMAVEKSWSSLLRGPESEPEKPNDTKEYKTQELRLRALQEKSEKALGQEFTYPRPVWIIWTYADENNIPKDTTVIISSLNEVRMRLWGLWLRNSNPAEVVLEAVARGMAIRLVYRLDTETAEKAMRNHELYTPPLPPRVLHGTFTWYWETWDEYLSLAKFVLSLPDAVVYLTLGGIVSRIATWLGPPDLVSCFAKGPSACASLQTTELDPNGNYLADAADPEQVRALYGMVEDPVDGTKRSWVPTQENLEYCGFWRGEWTDAHELWFLTRIGNIRDHSEHAKPLTAHQWSAQLKRRKVRWYDKHNPDPNEIEKIHAEFALETGGPWNGATLKEMESRFGYDWSYDSVTLSGGLCNRD
ncbi:hypothetical protein BC629DRAFT_1443200 [Irpex lacteus]|nr:hypothetical protein BC629DRAFT_1443200 [Irpex lacteus]